MQTRVSTQVLTKAPVKVRPTSTFVQPLGDAVVTPLHQCHPITIAADNSGSMGFDARGARWQIFLSELNLPIPQVHYLTWGSSARVVVYNQHSFSEGTAPTCLLDNPQTCQLLEEANCLVFMTDGEINETEMRTFATRLRSNPDLAILVLTLPNGSLDTNPSRLNMSVLAPFLGMNHLVLCLCDDSNLRILSSSLPEYSAAPISEYNCIRQLPNFTVENFKNLNIAQREQPPVGYSRVGDTFVNINQLFTTREPDFTFEELQLHFSNLALVARTQGKIGDLRNLIKIFEKRVDRELKRSPANSQEVRLLRSITEARSNGDDPSDLQRQLQTLRMEERSQRNQTTNRDTFAHRTKSEINKMYERLCELEKGGMDAGTILGCNRVARLEQSSCEELANYENSPRFECPICATEDAPIHLLTLETEENHLDDFSVTFPLAKGENPPFSSMAVCNECARSFVSTQSGPYREVVVDDIPLLDLTVESNRKYLAHKLNMQFGAGKRCYHLFRVFYAMLFRMRDQEYYEEIRSAIVNQMTYILDLTDNRLGMTEQGDVCTFREAMQSMVNPQYVAGMYDHPMTSVTVICESLPRDERVVHILLNRWVKWRMERWLSLLHPNNFGSGDKFNSEKERISNLYFLHPYGTKVDNTYRVPEYPRDEKFLVDFYKLVPSEEITLLSALIDPILYSRVIRHESPERMWNELLSSERLLFAYFSERTLPSLDQLRSLGVSRFIGDRFQERHNVRTQAPPFYSPWGPSKLRCNCGIKFGDPDTPINTVDINRASHFNEVYGSQYPTGNSSHYNAHFVVRNVMKDEEQLLTRLRNGEIIEEDIALMRRLQVAVMKRIDTLRNGNIYDKSVGRDMLQILYSFMSAVREFPDFNLRAHYDNQTLTNFEQVTQRESRYAPIVVPENAMNTLLEPFTEKELSTF